MVLFIGTYDLPPEDKMDAYMQAAPRWIATILRQPGLKEYRSYRNPYRGSPAAMTHYEFDSIESLFKYMQSEDFATVMSELRALGAHNFSTGQIWAASPTAPAPLKPTGR